MENFGNSIEEYDVFEQLGKGGFAVVFRAVCRRTGREVAIKKIDRKRIKAAGLEKRVNQEVEIHYGLKHPSILELHNFFEDESFVYLVLELCHNGELLRYLKSAKLSEAEACTIMEQVVDGLKYLHAQEIIHRDITLSNLLLTKDMRIKIADFGLAAQLQRPDEKHLTMCGTPNYISPEVATRGAHGKETDVWGLGIILYTCLVGKPPFDTENGLKYTLTLVAMSDIKFPSDMSSEAQDLIRSLLQKNPKDRMNISKILEHPLFLKYQATSFKSGLQRCFSYDSGVATASYLTSQRFNSYSQGILPSKMTLHSNHYRPPSPQKALPYYDDVPYSTTSNRPPFDNCSRSGHVCPSQDPSALGYDGSHHGVAPNRFLHNGTVSNQCSIASKRSGICETNCSHAWRQCQQCSHVDACGCMNVQRSYHSTAPKPEDNPVNNNNLKPGSRDRLTAPNLERTSGRESKSESIIGKITIPPICAKRLRPVRQKTKNVICSILSSGDVCLEFLKQRDGQEKVWEVMLISADGMRIVMYQPKKGRGLKVTDAPPPLPTGGADAIYNYENIPEKHWKKYSYAQKFIDLVKSRTPKITYYSTHAKCYLMENEPVPDFEACYYKGGKICKSQSKVTLTEPYGKLWQFDFFDDLPALSAEVQFMWEHFGKCLEHCGKLNTAITDLSNGTEEITFPAVFGRRPSQNSPLQLSNRNKENISPQSIVNIPTMRGYETSIASTRFGHSSKSRAAKTLKQVMIPGIGNVEQLTNGEIHINYIDATKVIVNSSSAEVTFTDAYGRTTQYKQGVPPPPVLRSRLEDMPMILKELKEIPLMDSG